VSGAGLALLLVVVVACSLVVLGLAVLRRRDVPRTVLAARRYGTTTSGLAVVTGVVAAAATAVLDPFGRLGSGVTALAVPLVYAVALLLVLLAGEAGWPRPRGGAERSVRRSDRRSVAGVSSFRWRRLLQTSAAAVVVVSALGWATADDGGRSVTVGRPGAQGAGAVAGTAGPYPGGVFAAPALVGAVVVVALVVVGLRLVASRPPVDGASTADDAVLRRASAHRLLRGASTGLLATAGGLLAYGGLALRSAAQPVLSTAPDAGGSPLLATAGAVATVLGVLAVVGALVVAHLPAPRPGPVRADEHRQVAPPGPGSW